MAKNGHMLKFFGALFPLSAAAVFFLIRLVQRSPSAIKRLSPHLKLPIHYIAFAERSSGKQPFFCLALGHDCLYLIGSQLQPITAGEVEPGQI